MEGINSVVRRMIKFVLKTFNLNGRILQIRSKRRATSVGIEKCGTSFELSKFQPDNIKFTCHLSRNQAQVSVVNQGHIAVITWFGTHIIVHGSKRSNFRRSTFKIKIKLLVLTKNLAKQLVFVAKDILKLNDSQRKTIGGSIITYIRVEVGDVSIRFAHEAKVGEVAWLAFDLFILL
jgi:hypothetical protein